MFTLRHLARRSLRYYFRAQLGVLAGATLAAAVLIGALAVGDSVRESLKERAKLRLAYNVAALNAGDRFFSQNLVDRLVPVIGDKEVQRFKGDGKLMMWYRYWGNRSTPANPYSPVSRMLALPATLARQDGTARANRIKVYGVSSNEPLTSWTGPDPKPDFSGELLWVNQALAQQLKVKPGEQVVLRLHKPTALSPDAVIAPRDDTSVALRVTVGGIMPDIIGGNLNLQVDQNQTLNAFLPLPRLANAVGLADRANLLLARDPWIEHWDRTAWKEKLRHWLGFVRLEQLVPYKPYETPMPAEDYLAFLGGRLAESWTLADAELSVRAVTPAPKLSGGEPAPAFAELTTRRIFLEPAVVNAALATPSTATDASTSGFPAVPVLTYLVNSLAHGDELAPYSMVTAAGPPYTPADLRDDEIVVNDWLAADLGVKPGDTVALAYYRVDAGTQLVEHTNSFRVRGIVPLRALHADRTLMPEFPGLTKAESTRDWDAGFDLVHPIRDKDEAYWKQWRGTPKAFISLAAGQKMWANRFGDLTAIRWFAGTNNVGQIRDAVAGRIRANLDPADVGLRFTDVRTPALAAAETGTGQEFGGLMIGFSFFLIASALLLTAMLFGFSLEQRATETGLLLALGWEPNRVRRLLFREGLALAALGTVLGTIGGIYYAKGVLWGLTTIWRDAVNGAGLEFHLTPATLTTGITSSLAVAAVTLWFTLRKQARRPARELLNEGANEAALAVATSGSKWARWWAIGASVAALGMVGAAWATRESSPETFFGAGALLLIAGLLWVRVWLRGRPLPKHLPTLNALSLRGLSRRPSRSLGTVALLASAAFLIIAVGANKLDANRDATKRGSGTGGFALWAESSLPVIQDLNTRKGQEFYSLEPRSLTNVSFVPFRVRDGDDASCLNLNKAQRPRLLGVKPERLAQRGAFTFAELAKSVSVTNGWLALRPEAEDPKSEVPEIPGIADANSIQWALQKQLGDTLDYTDERGRPFKVRLVGAVANSILQGSVVIDEAEFVKRFPSEGGYRAFLVDAPAAGVETLSATLTRALQDTGLEVTPAARRLAQFNAVQNTYLNTFQILGGLGLLLGSVGLGVVVLRNVFERRGELAVMQAVGFERPTLQRFVLTEHAALLLLGLFVGTVAALVAVLPALLSPGAEVPWLSLSLTLLAVLLNGALWTWLATRRALRGRLLDSLRAL